jgi:hypothetical protein
MSTINGTSLLERGIRIFASGLQSLDQPLLSERMIIILQKNIPETDSAPALSRPLPGKIHYARPRRK